jgi:flagellar hook-length control protein FliK
MPANKAAAKVVDEHGLPPQKEQIAGTLETHAQDALSAAVAATPAAEPQPATPDALPADGAAQANAPNQSLPPIPHPASSSVAASTADLADQLPTPKEVKEPSHVQEPEAPEQERPRRDAPRQSDAIKSDASAATNLAATYTSVTLVAPGALPQSTSVATVSAIPSHGDALERKGVATLSGSGEPALTPGQHPDGPSSDALQTPAVRELAEPTRHVRESNGTSQNEMGRTNLGEADRVRFVQRVARAMHSAVDRGGEVRLRLSPPELGRLTLDVVVRDGVMSARLEAETQTARSLLVDNLPALRDRLAEQNLRIDRFEVNLRDGTSGSLPDHTPNQSGQHSQPHAPTPNRPKGALPGGVWTTSQPIVRHIQTNDQLNVVV